MKKILFIALSMALYSCNKAETASHKTSDATVAEQKDTDTVDERISKNQEFLDKFRTVKLDTLRFAAPTYDEPNIGPNISKSELQLFPADLNLDSYVGETAMFQAFLKFDINDNLYGLVARMPGEYSFTSMKLFFYDRIKDEIAPKYYEVADATGDAGYSEAITSWLFRDAEQLKSFSYHWTKVEKIEPDDPTRESRTDDYYLISLSPEKIDTVRVSSSELPKYRELFSQK